MHIDVSIFQETIIILLRNRQLALPNSEAVSNMVSIGAVKGRDVGEVLFSIIEHIVKEAGYSVFEAAGDRFIIQAPEGKPGSATVFKSEDDALVGAAQLAQRGH